MKRDLNLIRDILFGLEGAPPASTVQHFDFPDHSQMEIMEHIQLLLDDGFIEGKVMAPHGVYAVTRVTSRGHDFLDNARNDTIWKKVIKEAESKGASVSMTIFSKLLDKAVSKYMDLE